MKHIVHVNQHNIKANNKGEDRPVLTLKTYKENVKCNEAIVFDANGNPVGRFVYKPENPLSCGARVWFETMNGAKVEEL